MKKVSYAETFFFFIFTFLFFPHKQAYNVLHRKKGRNKNEQTARKRTNE